jgi:hypothetical protein
LGPGWVVGEQDALGPGWVDGGGEREARRRGRERGATEGERERERRGMDEDLDGRWIIGTEREMGAGGGQ